VVGDAGVQRLGSASFPAQAAFALCPRPGLVCRRRRRDRFGCSRGRWGRPPLNSLYQMPPIPKRVGDRL